MLFDAINIVDYLKTDRVIRCIVFLAKGNLTDLSKYIETATFEPRDVMLWAEYEKLSGDLNYKRLRDFNNTFEECTRNVKEQMEKDKKLKLLFVCTVNRMRSATAHKIYEHDDRFDVSRQAQTSQQTQF